MANGVRSLYKFMLGEFASSRMILKTLYREGKVIVALRYPEEAGLIHYFERDFELYERQG